MRVGFQERRHHGLPGEHRIAAPLGLGVFGAQWPRGVAPGYWNGWPFGPEEKVGLIDTSAGIKGGSVASD